MTNEKDGKMSDYKQTRDAASKVTTQYDKMLRNLDDDDLVERLRDTPNWMREGFHDWKDNVRTYDRAPFEAADRIEELEAKLAQGTIVEYDDGSRVSLCAFAGGASENGAWSHLTLMKEEQDGAVSFRRYTADGGWCSPHVSSTLAELKGQNDE